MNDEERRGEAVREFLESASGEQILVGITTLLELAHPRVKRYLIHGGTRSQIRADIVEVGNAVLMAMIHAGEQDKP